MCYLINLRAHRGKKRGSQAMEFSYSVLPAHTVKPATTRVVILATYPEYFALVL